MNSSFNNILLKRPEALIALVMLGLLCPLSAKADAEIDRGKVVYDTVGACASCHGPLGAGDGAAAAALNPKPRSFAVGTFAFDTDKDGKSGTEADLKNVIQNGAQVYGGSMMMVGRKDLPEADVKALVKYVLSLKKK